MTKESKYNIIGFVLIGVVMFGFTWYQSRQYAKQQEYQAQLDSIARAEALERMVLDSAMVQTAVPAAADAAAPVFRPYKDSCLNVAAKSDPSIVAIANDKIRVEFSTKGAQPYSVDVFDYRRYDSTALMLIPQGASELNINIYAGEFVDTKDFVFDVAEISDTSVVMRLPFNGGGYIQQKYMLEMGSYMVRNELSFVGMDNVIPRKVSSMDLSWKADIPRLEKGYKNEK
ncbi:MAG: hypothetical protein ACI39U_09480 [Candidatus Cryptobacteroides sp.]